MSLLATSSRDVARIICVTWKVCFFHYKEKGRTRKYYTSSPGRLFGIRENFLLISILAIFIIAFFIIIIIIIIIVIIIIIIIIIII